ncbi:MAG: hypothetical protein WCJ81_09185 [bacterium]
MPSPYDVSQNNYVLPRNIFTSGTMPGNTVMNIGDKNITVDGKNKKFAVYDLNGTEVVRIGLLADGTFGISLFDINGNLVININSSNGKISSADGKTVWDLVNNQFIVNDGANDRILIGKLS